MHHSGSQVVLKAVMVLEIAMLKGNQYLGKRLIKGKEAKEKKIPDITRVTTWVLPIWQGFISLYSLIPTHFELTQL